MPNVPNSTVPAFADQLRVLVFDLDGTLIDSNADLAASVNAVLAELGRPALSSAQVAGFVGQGVPALMERALAASGGRRSDATVAAATAAMLRHYDGHFLDATRLYGGVAECLPVLAKRFDLAVLTNKPERPAREILGGLGVAGCFRGIYGGDSFAAKKPDPVGLRAILGAAAPEAALMVGDSVVDIQTGRGAGAWTCAVGYGFTPRDWAAGAADWEVGTFVELAAALALATRDNVKAPHAQTGGPL